MHKGRRHTLLKLPSKHALNGGRFELAFDSFLLKEVAEGRAAVYVYRLFTWFIF